MIARAGASVGLSFLIVASAAIGLHRPDRRQVIASVATATERPEPPTRPAPVVTPGVAWEEPRRIAPVPSPAPPKASRKAPEGSFAKVLTRETMAEFCARIYGDPGLATAVWEANRDRLPRPDSTLRSGMILRTPQLP